MAPGWAPPGAPPPPPRRVGGYGGIVVVLVLVGVILLCGGLGATGFVLVAEIPPGAASPPDAVANLLDAVFHKQDADAAGPYVCDRLRSTGAIQQLIQQAMEGSTQGESPQISWSTPQQSSRQDDQATVTTDLTISGGRQDDRITQHWKATVADEGGWRVCNIKTSR